ncbi:ATP-binding protein [Streptomyces sp. NPDC057403]|uniref:ATP-binding protein n=1 Tax=Streptomyces sp. NPDC057403 TaxID=3346119 RepID=UPI0036A5890A
MTQANATPAADVQEAVLTACAPGRSQVVLIEGAPGLGKSTLLALVARQAAAAGALVLTAAADERPGGTGALRQLLDGVPEPGLSFPLEDRLPSPARTATAFCARLRNLARHGPAVLCVDDAQHADPQALQALRYVVRHAQPQPVVVAVATTAQGGRWQEPFGADAPHPPRVHRVRLALLGPGDTGRAVAAGHGPVPAHTVARLHRLSGGNPLLLHALLAEDALVRQPASDGPFARAVADCLRRSGPAALATAHALAVLGENPVAPALLAELVDGGEPVTLEGLSALRACGLLDGLGRRDPAVRAAALAGCEATRRARLRLRAAHALRATGAPAVAVAGPLLALHAEDARPPARTADRSLLACTAQDLAEAGRALREQGRRDRADTLLRAARQLSLQAGDITPGDEPRTAPSTGHVMGALA